MFAHSNIRDLLESEDNRFSILEEFASLSPKRKVLLCDHLFNEGRETFRNTVILLWPEATDLDIRKLENFLRLLKQTAH